MSTETSQPLAEGMATLHIGETTHELVEIRATGDIILEVTFENTSNCTKSIPGDLMQQLRISKTPITSTQVFYRVRLDTLKKHSKYFQHLLGSDSFGEGRLIAAKFAELAQANIKPSEAEPDQLPRIAIVDEDDATRTIGRETVFRDLLYIIHGARHISPGKNITITYMSVLVVLADRFDCMASVTPYLTGTGPFAKFKYPSTFGTEKSTEEILRQKILIFYFTNQTPKLLAATKELITRGSCQWTEYGASPAVTSATWWDLPDGLETELSYRRSRIIQTIASLQTHFLGLYTSRTRQCSLGYDSSAACDSYQLGEMIKFFTNKDILSLVPVSATNPEDPNYVWPDAYSGDIEGLIGIMRQCPGYQIDKNHSHCGLRTRILPALDYIQNCIDAGIGIQALKWKTDRPSQTWVREKVAKGNRKKAFVVGDKAVGLDKQVFEFKGRSARGNDLRFNSMGSDKLARELFTADSWNWSATGEEDPIRLPKTSPSLRF
ncbi:hypothetical protein F5884DRAFT_299568 [Xylogone sp. PMI_703]|nr:hypothetical protein F5884DRAFT_299568 [Xylogone sp. PMI_703]